jgi:hypothetical protein
MKQSNSFLLGLWIAARSLSSGRVSRGPLARNDGASHDSAIPQREDRPSDA